MTHNPLTDTLAWHGRAIMLLDLDAFFASVEQLDHPQWRGKPVIVGGDATRRGVVSTCSYEARAYGVRSAMPASTAARLCPHAIWTPGHYDRYREMSAAVMAIMRNESPFLQQVSVDEAFMDVTPSAANPESPVAIAQRIQNRVAHLGITCSIGLGVSKAVAKTASEQEKPRGLTIVYPGREATFLAPLPTKRMSGIGPRAQEALAEFGIKTLGDVVNADTAVLARVFGKNAELMRARCLGADTDPVIAEGDPAKQISNEISFAHDLTNRTDIEAAIATVAAKVGRRLRAKSMKAATVGLKIRYGDLSIRTAQTPLAQPTDDDFEFIDALYLLLDEVWTEGMPVRLVGCATSHFDETQTIQQETLFSLEELDTPNQNTQSFTSNAVQSAQRARQRATSNDLRAATDAVRNRFGESAVQFGREVRTRDNLTGSGTKNP